MITQSKDKNIMTKAFQKTRLLFFALLLIVFPAVFSMPAQAQKSDGAMKIKVYLLKEVPNADSVLVAAERRVKKTKKIADAALRELFKGETDAERREGLATYYTVESVVSGNEECAHNLLKPLGAYFIGVSIKKGVATVNFRPEAGCYLQTAYTMANMVMNPIDATLKQFESIKKVQYALDGKVITEWDA
jgi:spore germination protein GerM